MDVAAIRSAIDALPYGKRLPTATYVWDGGGEHLSPVLKNVCAELRRRLEVGADFNLIKFHTDKPKISFLS
jgi:hypothetical protein